MFDKILALQSDIARILIKKLAGIKKINRNHIALRLGRPILSPLTGDSIDARIEIQQEPLTIVKYDSKISTELEWLLPSSENNWFSPVLVPTSIANWARWYNPKIEACLDLNIRSKPSIYNQGELDEQYENYLKWWRKSIFALVHNNVVSKFKKLRIQEPSEIIKWYEKKSLCVWSIQCLFCE